MIEACHTRLIYGFFEICLLGNPGYCRILHQGFWLMQMDLCLDLELSMRNYLGIFLAEVWFQ